MMKKIFLGALVFSVGFTVLCGWQFYSLMKSADEARQIAGLEWARDSSARIHFLAEYKITCEYQPVSSVSEKPQVPITIQACIENVAQQRATELGLSVKEATGLAQVMTDAIANIDIPAPLRWL